MGALSKTLAAAAIVGVSGAGAGYYAHETIVPDLIEQEINVAYNASLADLDNKEAIIRIVQADSSTAGQGQRFSVEPTGFLTYSVVVPPMSLHSNNESQDEGIIVTGKIPEAVYNLTVSPVQAANYMMNDEAVSTWSLTSVADVDLSLDIQDKTFPFYTFDHNYKANCSLTHALTVAGDNHGYEFVTSGSSCEFSQVTREEESVALSSKAGGAFSIAMAKDPDGNDFELNVDAHNVEISLWNTYADEPELDATVVMSGMSFSVGYEGLQQQFGRVTSVNDVPNVFLGDVSVQDVVIKGEYAPDLPRLTVDGNFSIKDLKSDKAKVAVGLGYSVSDNTFKQPMFSRGELPTAAGCQLHFANVPGQQLSQTTFENIDDISELPFALVFIALDASEIVAENDGVVINANCDVSKGEAYSANFEAEHTLAGPEIPAGSGRLELEGYEVALEDLADFLWMPAAELNEMFNIVAPAQDVDGKKVWEYTIDKDSNVTLNGLPLGPIMP